MNNLPALALSAALLALGSAPAAASANIEATKACFSDNTSGKDRKALGKWVFLAMAAHPEIVGYSRVSAEDMDQSSRELADVFMRLVTRDCVQQMRRMMAEDGSASVKVAFEYLGQMAMQELMTNQDVNARFTGFEKFVDGGKVQAALAPDAASAN